MSTVRMMAFVGVSASWGKNEDGEASLDLLPGRNARQGRHRPSSIGPGQRLQVERPTGDDRADNSDGGRWQPRKSEEHRHQENERGTEQWCRADAVDPDKE